MTTKKSNNLSEINKKIAERIKQARDRKIGEKVDCIACSTPNIDGYHIFEQGGLTVSSFYAYNTSVSVYANDYYKLYPSQRSVSKGDDLVYLEKFHSNPLRGIVDGSEITIYLPGPWEDKLESFYKDAQRKNEEKRQKNLKVEMKYLEGKAREDFGIK